MNSSRYAEEGEGEDPAVALLAAAVEELAPRAKPVPPGHELVRDVRAEIHRVPRLGRPDQGRICSSLHDSNKRRFDSKTQNYLNQSFILQLK